MIGTTPLFLTLALAAVATIPADPYLSSSGSWGQPFADAWAIQRVGMTGGSDSAWRMLGTSPQPVVVAVIDTGLDWNHLDFHPSCLWHNPKEIAGNGKDDDGDGRIDDVIGWDFLENTGVPWDHDGHGTLVAGIIAAQHGNGNGIAGINPYARLMVLKAVNNFGHSRASYLAEALQYAADHGARIANLSVGGKGLTEIERAAVADAQNRGVLVVAAAGNDGKSLDGYGVASLPGVIVVASTDPNDEWLGFSNWGSQVSLAAPGLEVLSLRARRTDTMRGMPGIDYVAGSAYVGKDRRYYRASGTSFSAPIVSGIASLLLSKNPSLTSEDVSRILLHSARDAGTPGVDQHTGYGIVDARSALGADPRFFVEARITEVRAVTTPTGAGVEVYGAADADRFARARLEVGAGKEPASWLPGPSVSTRVSNGLLGTIPASALSGGSHFTLRLVVEHAGGRTREARFALELE
jgi:subtilisin family serine protease